MLCNYLSMLNINVDWVNCFFNLFFFTSSTSTSHIRVVIAWSIVPCEILIFFGENDSLIWFLLSATILKIHPIIVYNNTGSLEKEKTKRKEDMGLYNFGLGLGSVFQYYWTLDLSLTLQFLLFCLNIDNDIFLYLIILSYIYIWVCVRVYIIFSCLIEKEKKKKEEMITFFAFQPENAKVLQRKNKIHYSQKSTKHRRWKFISMDTRLTRL